MNAAISLVLAYQETHGIDFPELLTQLHASQFTGALTLHFGQGQPVGVEVAGESVRFKLDRRKSDRRQVPRAGDRRRV